MKSNEEALVTIAKNVNEMTLTMNRIEILLKELVSTEKVGITHLENIDDLHEELVEDVNSLVELLGDQTLRKVMDDGE